MFIMILYVMIFFCHSLCKNNNKKTKMKKKSNKFICFLLTLSNFSYFGSAESTFTRK